MIDQLKNNELFKEPAPAPRSLPKYLEFPLGILEAAFGNCVVKLTRCDNDFRLPREHREGLKRYPYHHNSNGLSQSFSRDNGKLPDYSKKLSEAEVKLTKIGFKNCPYSEFKLVLVHDTGIIKEGWGEENGEPVYYADFRNEIDIKPKIDPVYESTDGLGQTVINIRRRNNKYECGYCKMKFTRRYSAYKHQIKSCMSNRNSKAFIKSLSKEDNTKNPYYPNANKVNLSPGILSNVNKLHTKPNSSTGKIDIDELLFPQSRGPSALPGRHKCTECAKTFNRSEHAKKHIMSVHLGLKPYKCKICEKHFSRREHVKTHMVAVHTNERPYKCFTCQKRFSSRSNLNSHKSTHIPWAALPHRCPYPFCGQKFRRRYNLILHANVHKADRERFECPYCLVKVTRKQYLKFHIRKFHSNFGDGELKEDDKRLGANS